MAAKPDVSSTSEKSITGDVATDQHEATTVTTGTAEEHSGEYAAKAASPHVSLSAETIGNIGSFQITNSIFTSLIVSTILIVFALYARTKIKSTDKPSGLQNVVEMVFEALFNLINGVADNRKKAAVLFPYIASFFFFIILNNWLGLVPGVGTIGVEYHGHHVPLFRPGTADLNTTLALAIFSVVTTQVIGFRYLSFGYFKKYFNFSSPIMFFVGILEIISEFAKIVSFAFRLFGNIFAGEVLLVVIAFLVPIIVPMPFYGLEIFVGMIQALVFAMLSLVFFNMATVSHDEH